MTTEDPKIARAAEKRARRAAKRNLPAFKPWNGKDHGPTAKPFVYKPAAILTRPTRIPDPPKREKPSKCDRPSPEQQVQPCVQQRIAESRETRRIARQQDGRAIRNHERRR